MNPEWLLLGVLEKARARKNQLQHLREMRATKIKKARRALNRLRR